MQLKCFSRPAIFATALAALALPVLAFPACSQSNGSDKNAPLIASPNSPIADVPIPVGFHMTEDSTSNISPAAGVRVVDHRYKGSDDLLPIVKFYRDQMPEKGWTWIEQNQARGGEVTLHFTKNNEDCVITVTPGSWGKNFVQVKIDPIAKK